MESRQTLIHRIWYLVVTFLITGNLVLLSLHLSTVAAGSRNHAVSFTKLSSSLSFINHLGVAVDRFGLAAKTEVTNTGYALLSGVSLAIYGAGHLAGSLAYMSPIGSLIRPGNKVSTPVIEAVAYKAAPAVTQANAPAPNTPVANISTTPQWPMHGRVTLPFGVSDWPYEVVHTGIDISDGARPGVTPVRPFEPGKVVGALYDFGLGNHVVIDNGGGVTSVYGHLYSIAVHQGEAVNQNSTLGYEGSTGESTGTHVHFEVRVNGRPVNPRQYIPGLP